GFDLRAAGLFADDDRHPGAGVIELDVGVGPVLDAVAVHAVQLNGRIGGARVRPTVVGILRHLRRLPGAVIDRDGDVRLACGDTLELHNAGSHLADDGVQGGLQRRWVGGRVVAGAGARLRLSAVDGKLVERVHRRTDVPDPDHEG